MFGRFFVALVFAGLIFGIGCQPEIDGPVVDPEKLNFEKNEVIEKSEAFKEISADDRIQRDCEGVECEIYEMRSDYPHKKGIVIFDHDVHTGRYFVMDLQELLFLRRCGECHHDSSGQPVNMVAGYDITSILKGKCFDCHNKPGLKPRGAELTREERLAYHAEAVHEKCKTCHKKYNKEYTSRTMKAPVSCKGCHPKKKR